MPTLHLKTTWGDFKILMPGPTPRFSYLIGLSGLRFRFNSFQFNANEQHENLEQRFFRYNHQTIRRAYEIAPPRGFPGSAVAADGGHTLRTPTPEEYRTISQSGVETFESSEGFSENTDTGTQLLIY